MKYSPSESGHFDGQRGYGYISIEKFVDAARSVNAVNAPPSVSQAERETAGALPSLVIPGRRVAASPGPRNTDPAKRARRPSQAPLRPCSWIPGPALGRPGMTSGGGAQLHVDMRQAVIVIRRRGHGEAEGLVERRQIGLPS